MTLALILTIVVGAMLLSHRLSARRQSTPQYGLPEWRLDRDKAYFDRRRSHLAEKLHVSGELVGKLKKDVLIDLGVPDRNTKDGTLIYVLGPDPSFGIDVWELHVKCDSAGLVSGTCIMVY